jgi:hypothetical protein
VGDSAKGKWGGERGDKGSGDGWFCDIQIWFFLLFLVLALLFFFSKLVLFSKVWGFFSFIKIITLKPLVIYLTIRYITLTDKIH